MVQLLTGHNDSQKVRKAEKLLGRFPTSWVQENKEKSSEEVATKGIVDISYTVISTNVVGSKHEAKRQDRKFMWDFYE